MLVKEYREKRYQVRERERDNESLLSFLQGNFIYGWMRATHNVVIVYVFANGAYCCAHATWFCRTSRMLEKIGIVNLHVLIVCTLLCSLFLFLCILLRRVLVIITILFLFPAPTINVFTIVWGKAWLHVDLSLSMMRPLSTIFTISPSLFQI